MKKWLKISHNGEMRYVDFPDSRSGGTFLNAVHREINCDLIEFVYCRFFHMKLCLMIDDHSTKIAKRLTWVVFRDIIKYYRKEGCSRV